MIILLIHKRSENNRGNEKATVKVLEGEREVKISKTLLRDRMFKFCSQEQFRE